MSFGTYALIVLAGCVSVVLVGGLAGWLINRQEDPGRHFKPIRERPLEPVDAQTVEFMHALHEWPEQDDRCTDPPEVSCADTGCPVHGWHPLDDWDEPVTLNVPRPRHGAQGEPEPQAQPFSPYQPAAARHTGNDGETARPGHSLVLFRRDRTVPFHTAGRLQEACQTAALIAYAESILAGVSA